MDSTLAFIGAVSAFIAIFAGGARAHLLERRLPKERLPLLEVGMRYQAIHALAILICSIATHHFFGALPYVAGYTFLAGTVIFCGAVYTFALTGSKPAMKLTPLGGAVFLAGWLLLAAATLRG